MTTPTAPPLAVSLDTIPQHLQDVDRWVLWKLVPDPAKPEKPKKIPFQATHPTNAAKSTDPATWADFATTVQAYRAKRHSGVGFCLGDGWAGVDFDGCHDPETGAIAEWAATWIARLATYAEVSPSCTGVKLIARAEVVKPLKLALGDHIGVEVYGAGRYFTITGHRLENCPTEPQEAQEGIDALLLHFRPVTTPTARTVASTAQPAQPVTSHSEGWRADRDKAVDEKIRWWVDGKKTTATEQIRNAPGGYHNMRYAMARLLGGVITYAPRYLSEQDALSILYDAKIPDSHDRTEVKAIMDGLRTGMSTPFSADDLPTFPTDDDPAIDDRGFARCPRCGDRLLKSKPKYPYPGTTTPGWYCPRCKHPMVWPVGAVDVQNQPTGTATPQPRTTALSRSLVLKCLKEEEAGDAQLFTHLYEGRYLFDRAASAWYAFADHIWQRQPGPPRPAVWGRIASAYLALAASLQSDLEAASEDDQKKLNSQIALLIGRAKSLRRLTRCNAVLTLAGDMGMLGFAGDAWDADPWVIAVSNGVLDLRTGQLRDGQPTDYIRTQAPTAWEGIDAPAPRWGQFLNEVMSKEADRVGFLHRAFGYALNGTTREHMLVLLIGEQGRNGKGVLFGTLRNVLGDYAASVSNDVIIGQSHNRTAGTAQPHLVSLRGKRIAYTSETADGDQMSAAQVKLITGGDAITARDLYEKQVTFTPSHTLFVATNRRPHASADDDALWERVKVLDFKARFLEDPDPTKPNEQKHDLALLDTLALEAPGILAWLVRGHMAYQKDGLGTPASVKLARDTYRLGESIDPFIAARCDVRDGDEVEGGVLWEAYRAWCDGAKLKVKTQHWFGRQLATRFEKGRAQSGRVVYYGLSVALQTPPTLQKGSEGIRTPDNAVMSDVSTRFPEPFTPISKRELSISLVRDNSSKTPQKVRKVRDDIDHTATATADTFVAVAEPVDDLNWEVF